VFAENVKTQQRNSAGKTASSVVWNIN
jgi:hypothetical protein